MEEGGKEKIDRNGETYRKNRKVMEKGGWEERIRGRRRRRPWLGKTKQGCE